MELIHKVAALVVRERKLLVVRKGQSDIFVSPGGQPQPGDKSPEETLRRDLVRDLGVEATRVVPFRVFSELATSGEARVFMDSYLVQVAGEPREGPAVSEMAWVDSDGGKPLALILKNSILPALKAANLID